MSAQCNTWQGLTSAGLLTFLGYGKLPEQTRKHRTTKKNTLASSRAFPWACTERDFIAAYAKTLPMRTQQYEYASRSQAYRRGGTECEGQVTCLPSQSQRASYSTFGGRSCGRKNAIEGTEAKCLGKKLCLIWARMHSKPAPFPTYTTAVVQLLPSISALYLFPNVYLQLKY